MGKKIFLFLGMMVWCLSCKAVTLQQKFDVGIGIFDAAQIEFVYESTDNNFVISTNVSTTNLFDTLYPFLGRYQSEGGFRAGRVVPLLYQTYTKSRNHVRTKKIFYDKDGIAYKRVSTKDKKVSEAAIDNVPKNADAADLQSVFVDLIKVIKLTQKCNLKREIYDGKKHYRVVVTDGGKEQRYFDYFMKEDEGQLCLIYIENIKDNNDNILWEVSADKPIKLWFKQNKMTKMPYVLEIGIDSTPLGALKVVPTAVDIK